MINVDEINTEIVKLESQPTSYATIERLSWLYTVRDHIAPVTGADIPKGDSEYYCACAGRSINEIMSIMDELMSTLMVIQPRLYEAVLAKLS